MQRLEYLSFHTSLFLHVSLFLSKYYPSNSRCIAYISLMLCARHRNLLKSYIECEVYPTGSMRIVKLLPHDIKSRLRTRKAITISLGSYIKILYLTNYAIARNNFYLIFSREYKKNNLKLSMSFNVIF